MGRRPPLRGELDCAQVSTKEFHVTWDSSGRSVLKLNIRLLYFMGLWNLKSFPGYWAYTAFLLTFSMCTFITNIASIALSGGNMELLVMAIVVTLAMISAFAKAFLLFTRRPDFERLINRLDCQVTAQRRFSDRESGLRTILRHAKTKPLVLMGVTGIYFTIIAVQWGVTPLVADDGSKTLPYNQLPWLESCSMSLYYFHYVQQILSIPYCGSITFAMEFFFLSVMISVSAQFRIVSSRLTSLGQDGQQSVTAATEKASVYQQPVDAYRELCRCIETHQELLRYVEFLDNVMSPFAMLQFVVGTLSICVVLYQTTDSQVRSSNMKCAAWLPGASMQLFIYCLGAHEVSDQGEAVSEAAYGSPWVESSPRVRQAVRLLITRAQVPPVLTAGHLYPISRATFVSLVNASYSYYALLRQVNDR